MVALALVACAASSCSDPSERGLSMESDHITKRNSGRQTNAISISRDSKPKLSLVRAKNIDYTPDITSDPYWDTHHICVVHVTSVDKNAAGKQQITYEVIRQMSEGPIEKTRTLLLSHLWFGPDVEEPPPIWKDDNLVIYYAKDGPSPIVTTKLDTIPEDSDLTRILSRIVGFRANEGGIKALSEGVFDREALIPLYCLKRLLNRSRLEVEVGYVARLRNLRDQENAKVQVRLLASRLANKIEDKPANSEEEYLWVRASMKKAKYQEWTQVRPFVARLLEFENRRKENVAFLVQLVRDSNNMQAIRIAAYSSFEDPNLFYFSQPDNESDSIFDTCIEMLGDRDTLLRSAGAALLHNISIQIDKTVKGKYTERAKSAIDAAIAVEKNDVCRTQMENYLKLINENLSKESSQ